MTELVKTNGPQERTVAPHGVVAAIGTLGIGGLFLGTGEFASMSLLPDMAKSTNISIPDAGAFISAYAFGVVVGAPLIAIGAARWPRKRLLFALLLLVVIGYVGSALAWNYSSLIGARFISGLPHGAYYGVAALVAASMVEERKRAQAIGYTMMGLAAANVIGVPIATSIGQSFGWRSAFFGVAAGAAVSIVLLRYFVPVTPSDKQASPMNELSGLKKPQVWLTLAIASVGFGGMFAVYSYITPTLTEVTGFALGTVPVVLAIWGVGMIAGNLVGGWLADRALIPAIFLILGWNVIFLGLFSVVAESQFLTLIVLFLIGIGFALVPALQTRLMNVAGDAQTLAAALNHSAFNIANAVGAILGAYSISKGFGWASTGWVGAILAAGSIVFLIVAIYPLKNQGGSPRS